MRHAGLSNAAIDAFKHNYEQLVAGVTGLVRSLPLLSKAKKIMNLIPALSLDHPLCRSLKIPLSQWKPYPALKA